MMKARLSHLFAVVGAGLIFSNCDNNSKFGDTGDRVDTAENLIVQDLEPADFNHFVAIKNKLVVVDFHAHWCGPCKELAPKLEALAGEFTGKIVVGKINVDDAKKLSARLGVHGIPDVRVFRNGVQVDRFVGDLPESEIRDRLEVCLDLNKD